MKLLLIILLCVIKLEFGACSKCIFIDYGFGYTCYIDLFSSSREEQHKHGKTDNDIKIIEIVGNSSNRLSEVELDPFCRRFKNVITITIERIEAVSDDLFGRCVNLKDVTISYSEIKKVPVTLFSKLSNLEWIYFNQNNLKNLPENLFFNLAKLTTIDINGNKLIEEWPENIFLHQINLEKLYLRSNNISYLPAKIFNSLTKLKRLNLGSNKIHSLNPKWFENLVSLEYLVLVDNKIQDLPKNVFKNAKKLQEIYLHGNLLTTIHSDSFGILDNLKFLGLNNNKISSIDEQIMDLKNLNRVYMNGNICSEEKIIKRNQMKEKLQKCFDDYTPRVDPMMIKCGTLAGRMFLIQRGNITSSNEYPWNALLVTNEDDQFFCGGTVVSSRHVVTAAHCIKGKRNEYEFNKSKIYVLLGVYNFTKDWEEGRIAMSISSIFVHPDWNVEAEEYEADIAVLELVNEINFNKFVRPICIPEVNSPVSSATRGIAVGFGFTENGITSDVARKLEIPIYTFQNCTKHSPDHRYVAGPRSFCGGWADGSGVCTGDSGGGVYVIYRNAVYLRGIISTSLPTMTGECDVERESIFTDIPKFYGWIKSGGVNDYAPNRKIRD